MIGSSVAENGNSSYMYRCIWQTHDTGRNAFTNLETDWMKQRKKTGRTQAHLHINRELN